MYLFAAYCAIWLILFAYVFSLKSRQQTLDRTLESIQKQLEKLN